MFDLEECVSFIMNRNAKKLAEILNYELMKQGVTKSQWFAMYFIEKNIEISQKDLAELMDTSGPTITGILDRLEKENLIERKTDEKDKRKKLLRLSPKGLQRNQQLTRTAQEFRDVSLSNISLKDQEKFLEIMNDMLFNAEQWSNSKK